MLIFGRQVAFFVYMSQNVMINTISKYKTGNFTAPESGVYVFHTTTAAFDNSHSTIEIVANGQVKDITWADAMDHNDRAVASSMTVLSLTEGDSFMSAWVYFLREIIWRVINTPEWVSLDSNGPTEKIWCLCLLLLFFFFFTYLH